jgi:allantoicase
MSDDNDWTACIDLAAEKYGGAAILCNDEFFAEKDNLLRPHPAVWKEHEYTDRGKWMDGWETRRRREPGL